MDSTELCSILSISEGHRLHSAQLQGRWWVIYILQCTFLLLLCHWHGTTLIDKEVNTADHRESGRQTALPRWSKSFVFVSGAGNFHVLITSMYLQCLPTTPFLVWDWSSDKTVSAYQHNSAPHSADGERRLTNLYHWSPKLAFRSSMSKTSALSSQIDILQNYSVFRSNISSMGISI